MVLKLIYKDTVIKTLTYELWEISIENTCTPVYIQKIQLLGKNSNVTSFLMLGI